MSADTISYTFDVGGRTPLVVTDGWIDAGGRGRRFRTGSQRSLLTSYVKLVRSMRKAQPRTTVNLRVSDVQVIAEYLHESREHVIDCLADVIGAPRIERPTLVSMLAGGAAVITLVTGVAVHVAGSGHGAKPQGRDRVSQEATTVAPLSPLADATRPLGARSHGLPPQTSPMRSDVDVAVSRRNAPTSRLGELRRAAMTANRSARTDVSAMIRRSDREIAEHEVDAAPVVVGTADDGSKHSIFTPPLPPSDAPSE